MNYYTFQFQDGSWRIALMTNRKGGLPRSVVDGIYGSRAAAEQALRDAAIEDAAEDRRIPGTGFRVP